jgi:hypothetical protein
MDWQSNFGFLEESFWRDVVNDDPRRVWQVNALFGADLFLRDAYAWGLLRDRLRDRGERVKYMYVRAWDADREIPFEEMGGRDLIFLGRTKGFESTRLGPYGYAVGSRLKARFIDAFDGRLGDSVLYGKRVFTQHGIEVTPEPFRRCDVDYAVLSFHVADVGFQVRRLLGISGLSTLGTLGLTLILVDDDRRRELARQVREVCPWDAKLRPWNSFEICVRIQVNEKHLADFLNRPKFDFRVEVVAVEGGESRVREDRAELRLGKLDGRHGTVTIGGEMMKIPTRRFELLLRLVQRNGEASAEELCDDLGLPLDGAAEADVKKKRRGLLAKMVHDLNATFKDIPGLPQGRVIQMRGRRYVLAGVRGVGEP